MNSCRRQTVHRGKVDPGVIELPWGNELSRDQVNRPLGTFACLAIKLDANFYVSFYVKGFVVPYL